MQFRLLDLTFFFYICIFDYHIRAPLIILLFSLFSFKFFFKIFVIFFFGFFSGFFNNWLYSSSMIFEKKTKLQSINKIWSIFNKQHVDFVHVLTMPSAVLLFKGILTCLSFRILFQCYNHSYNAHRTTIHCIMSLHTEVEVLYKISLW